MNFLRTSGTKGRFGDYFLRLGLVWIGFAALLAATWVRLFFVQVVCSNSLANRQREQGRVRVNLEARRGRILDRNHTILADEIPIKRVDSPEGAAGSYQRIYPYGFAAGRVVGMVGRDGYGLAGLEYAFDETLRGREGWAVYLRDGRQKVMSTENPAGRPAVNGFDIVTTLDMQVQQIVDAALERGVAATGARAGMALAMVPATGEILAMSSVPGFNPNVPGSGGATNPLVSYTYEPGSTFKLITAAAVLERSVFQETDRVDARGGKFQIYGDIIRDNHDYGIVTFANAVVKSSNVAFARIALKLGQNPLYRAAFNFGMGTRTGIPLPGEEPGLLHPLAEWSGRSAVTVAIGHEVLATPLQMAQAFAAVANEGVMMSPLIVREIRRNGKVCKEFAPQPVRQVVSAATARRLKTILRAVVDSGTALPARIDGVDVAGKTGTTIKVDLEKKVYNQGKFIASFIGFAPVQNPQLLLAVILDEPGHTHSGGQAAAPLFREMLVQILQSPELPYGRRILRPAPTAAQMAKSGTAAAPPAEPRSPAGAGETAAIFPSVEGMSLRQALQVLQPLPVKIVIDGRGVVVSQEPRPGTAVLPGATCVLKAKV